MFNVLRRISLGFILIALVSAVLLFSDGNRRSAPGRQMPRVAVFQFSSRPLLEEGVAGVVEGLRQSGFVEERKPPAGALQRRERLSDVQQHRPEHRGWRL